MKIATKRIIYGFFMVIFLMAAPLLLLYATGYRFNFKKNTLEKTGVIFLETVPRDVAVTLNQKLVGIKTPLRLKNLKPNDYDVTIAAEGFYTWAKSLTVQSGQTTFAQFVRLFKKDSLPQISLAGQSMTIIPDVARDNEFYIFQPAEKLTDVFMLNSRNGQISELGSLDLTNFDDLAIANGRLLVKQGNRFSTYALSNITQATNLNNFFISSATHAQIDTTNPNFIWGMSANLLFRYNLSSGQRDFVLEQQVLDFAAEGNDLFIVEDGPNKNFKSLKQLSVATQEFEKEIVMLPTDNAEHFQIITDMPGHILVLDEAKQILYVNKLEGKSLNPTDIIPNVAQVLIAPSGNEFLYYNDFEIWHYAAGTKKLLTRLASGVTEVIWYPVPTHLLFVGSGSRNLSVMETVETSFRDKIDLVTLDSISYPVINKAGDTVYFVGQIGNQEGLFELKIQ